MNAGSGPPEQDAPALWPTVPDDGRLLALVPDLMDRSKIASARPDTIFLRNPAALVQGDVQAADVVLVDLNRSAVLDRLTGCPARVIGFVSHVDAETADRARSAGIEVLARSAFFDGCRRRIAELIRREQLLRACAHRPASNGSW